MAGLLTSGISQRAVIFYTLFTFAAMAYPAGYGGGSGTAEDPYQIWTAEQMKNLSG